MTYTSGNGGVVCHGCDTATVAEHGNGCQASHLAALALLGDAEHVDREPVQVQACAPLAEQIVARDMIVLTGRTPIEHRDPATVARLCLAAHRQQEWGRLRTLFHPKARIGTFAGGGRPEEPEVAIRRLQEAHSDLIYSADVASLVDLDDKAVLLKGSVRHRSPNGGWSVVERTWLYVVRDGLLYRSAMYESEHQALAAYASTGATLGIAD